MQNKMMIETWAQYTHLEKLYGYLPGMDEELPARLFGLPADPELQGPDGVHHSLAGQMANSQGVRRALDVVRRGKKPSGRVGRYYGRVQGTGRLK